MFVFYVCESISVLSISSSVSCFLDSTYKWCHMVLSFPDLLSVIISRSIRVAVNSIVSFFFFFYSWVIVHCTYVPHLLYLFTCHLSCFHVLVIVNIAAVSIRVKVQLFVIKAQLQQGRETPIPFLFGLDTFEPSREKPQGTLFKGRMWPNHTTSGNWDIGATKLLFLWIKKKFF